MLITCPSCSSKFAVKAEAIGASGRKVRCAKCKHDWFQEPIAGAIEAASAIPPEPQAAEPVPEGSNLPAHVAAAVATPMYMKAAFACAIVLFLFTLSLISSNKILPHMGWYYSMLGIHDDSGIALYNVSAEKVGDDKSDEFVVKGRIVNDSNISKSVPDVRITLLGEGHEKVRVITVNPSETALEPGQGVDFENKIQKMPDNVSTIVMDLGSGINLASR